MSEETRDGILDQIKRHLIRAHSNFSRGPLGGSTWRTVAQVARSIGTEKKLLSNALENRVYALSQYGLELSNGRGKASLVRVSGKKTQTTEKREADMAKQGRQGRKNHINQTKYPKNNQYSKAGSVKTFLDYVRENPGQSAAEITDGTGLAKSTIYGIIGQLDKEKIIERSWNNPSNIGQVYIAGHAGLAEAKKAEAAKEAKEAKKAEAAKEAEESKKAEAEKKTEAPKKAEPPKGRVAQVGEHLRDDEPTKKSASQAAKAEGSGTNGVNGAASKESPGVLIVEEPGVFMEKLKQKVAWHQEQIKLLTSAISVEEEVEEAQKMLLEAREKRNALHSNLGLQ